MLSLLLLLLPMAAAEAAVSSSSDVSERVNFIIRIAKNRYSTSQ
jgi:hypothetical protein